MSAPAAAPVPVAAPSSLSRSRGARPAAASTATACSLWDTMELSPSSGGAAEALSWPEMFSGLESDSPLPPEDLDAVVPVSGAVAGGMLDRILLESVCQQQSWVRVYGKDHRSSVLQAGVSYLSMGSDAFSGPHLNPFCFRKCVFDKFIQCSAWVCASVGSLDLFRYPQ